MVKRFQSPSSWQPGLKAEPPIDPIFFLAEPVVQQFQSLRLHEVVTQSALIRIGLAQSKRVDEKFPTVAMDAEIGSEDAVAFE